MDMAMCVTMLLAMAALSGGQELSSKECENLGFTGLALCSDCKTFAEYVKDQGFFLLPFFPPLNFHKSLIWDFLAAFACDVYLFN